jgi:four helix bundle protein
MSEQAERLKKRTMQFAHDVCALIKRIPMEEPGPTVRHQLAKSSTSVAFNYRASCRARSHAEFTAKIGLVSEESDESLGWLEFTADQKLMSDGTELCRLIDEARSCGQYFRLLPRRRVASIERNGRNATDQPNT